MPTVPLTDLQAFARRAAGDQHDSFSEAALARALEEYREGRVAPIAPVRLTLGDRVFDSIFTALAEPEVPFADGELTVVDPPGAGATWEWTFPLHHIAFRADGSAGLHPVGGGPPARAILRILRRDYYVPRPQSSLEMRRADAVRDPRPGILALEPAVALMRRAGFVPFAVALLAYTANERFRFEIDLTDSTLLRDPRAGRLPTARRVRRTSRVAHDVDMFVARGELAVRTARVLEMLVESHGLTPFEVSQVFGGVSEFASSALRTLQSRGLATLDRQTGVYRPRFEPFRAEGRGGGAEASQPLPNPALRTSVMELLAAADARATCPLCGDPLPAGPRAILCARCQAEVNAADSAPR